jgi:hypothetical protein
MKSDSWEKIAAIDKSAKALEGEVGGWRGPVGPDTIASVSGALSGLLQTLQEADVTPTASTVAAVQSRHAALKTLMQHWEALKTQE